jgi:hypothetical protein
MIEANLTTTTMTEPRKSVNLRKETWERLQSFGKFRESTDELLNRLMDIATEYQKKGSKK